MAKFYISHNRGAVTGGNEYWSRPAQNWTTDPMAASLFLSRGEAEAEAVYADAYGPGEAVVCVLRWRDNNKPGA